MRVDKTVAEPESLKKLLITWLMRIRLWECEINHQPWDELLKWSLVFCLLSLGNGFSCLHHQVNRCRAAALSSSESGNSRWPGPAFPAALLHEQFIAHSAVHSVSRACVESLPRDGASVNGCGFPDDCICPRTSSLHTVTHTASYKHVTKETPEVFLCALREPKCGASPWFFIWREHVYL